MLGAVVERLMKALRDARPATVRQFFALAGQHMRWELNDLARILDSRVRAEELNDEQAVAPADSDSGLTPDGRRIIAAIDRLPDDERSMKSLARYGLVENFRQEFQTLSGGQKARLEILCLELEGHNVLLLDEPTDNLDVDSSEALERALDGFVGTVIAVSHDRAFLATLDRFLMITDDGEVFGLPDDETAMLGLVAPDRLAALKHAKNLTRV